jgi:SAM-dependent methyltransferase
MTSGFLGQLTRRPCPVCGSTDDGDEFAAERLDGWSPGSYAFASRKRPEHMRLRLVACPVCDLVYASHVPAADVLAEAYEEAAFDSATEARYAARTYGEALAPLIDTLPDRDGALDIGTGDGAFLRELLDAGFARVRGVEPSTAPIAVADPEIAPLIDHGVFRSDMYPAASLSLLTCFQTIEHVPDPARMVRDAAGLLKPGGVLALVCHDRRAPVNRLLGLRSPIIDIEHQQLFSPASVRALLHGGGLVEVRHRAICNRYPLRYWVRLLALPGQAGELVERALGVRGAGDRPLTLPVGNLLAWGRKAAGGGEDGARD